jgi:hypothetical protein
VLGTGITRVRELSGLTLAREVSQVSPDQLCIRLEFYRFSISRNGLL